MTDPASNDEIAQMCESLRAYAEQGGVNGIVVAYVDDAGRMNALVKAKDQTFLVALNTCVDLAKMMVLNSFKPTSPN